MAGFELAVEDKMEFLTDGETVANFSLTERGT